MKEKTPEQILRKNIVLASVIAISFILFGVSVSYAYFTLNITGEVDVPENQAGNLNISSTIESAEPITAVKLALIDSKDYKTKGKKVTFSVTNHGSECDTDPLLETCNNKPGSNLKAKYIIKIDEMSLSKNLFSKYFKWAIEVNGEEKKQGNFSDQDHQEGYQIELNEDNTPREDMIETELTKTLIGEEDAFILEIGHTDTINFYIWLENDGEYNFQDPTATTGVDQGYLMNGSFQGKLAIEAIPVR